MPNNVIDPVSNFVRPSVQGVPYVQPGNQEDEQVRNAMDEAIRNIRQNRPYTSDMPVPTLASEYTEVGRMKSPSEIKAEKAKLPSLTEKIRINTKPYTEQQDMTSGFRSEMDAVRMSKEGIVPAPERVPIEEVYDVVGDVALPKYKQYTPGIDNAEISALMQARGEKWRNGFAKLALKTGLYGVSGTLFIPTAIGGWINKGSFSGVYDNKFQDFINQIDERINHSFNHYYSREEQNMNLLQKMGTANFWANDVIGNGLSFTTGAMLTAFLTGGMGLSSLGTNAARAGLRSAAKAMAKRAPSAVTIKGAAAETKNLLSEYTRRTALRARPVNTARAVVTLATSSGYESAVEANSVIKDSEERYRDYIRNNYGREATDEEVAAFQNEYKDVANWVFAGNMAVVGSSNFMTLGKFMGFNSYILQKIPGISKASKAAKSGINKHLFGIGVRRAADGSGKLAAVPANLGQRTARTIWNVSKRPISEGIYEEGLQGVFQNAAEDYIDSRYDKNAFQDSFSFMDVVGRGFQEQYSSKEGWVEMGVGAMIGAMFGAREGMFGVFEGRNAQRRTESLVKAYNENKAFTMESVKDLMRNSVSFNSIVSHGQQEKTTLLGDSNTDSGEYSKFAISDRMGVLDENAAMFEDMVDAMDTREIMSMFSIAESQANDYKRLVVDDYRDKVSRYKEAKRFSEAVTEGTDVGEFKDFIAEVAYKGLASKSRMLEAANEIASLSSSDPALRDSLSIFSKLSKATHEKAKELGSMAERINRLDEAIRRRATSPSRVDGEGRDTEAEWIKQETEKLENMRKEYESSLRELESMSVRDFNENDFIGEVSELASSVVPTGEQVLSAYDAVRSLDYYLSRLEGGEAVSASDQTLGYLVDEYKANVVNYKNLNNMLQKFGDRRFLYKQAGIFRKAVSKKADDILSIPVDRVRDNGTSRIDQEIDQAVRDGKMTEDEAFTARLFNHLRDGILDNEEYASEAQKGDLIEEMYKTAIDGGLSLNESFFMWDSGIANKILMDGEESLTDRERTYYNERKGEIDGIVDRSSGDSSVILENLRKRSEAVLKEKHGKEANDLAIEEIRSGIGEKDLELFDNLVNRYGRAVRKRNEEEMRSIKGELYAVTAAYGVASPAPFISDNVRIEESGSEGVKSIKKDYGVSNEEKSDLNEDGMPENTSTEGEVVNAQNTSSMFVRTVDGGSAIEFSNLDAESFVDKVAELAKLPYKKESIKLDKVSYLDVQFETPDGATHTFRFSIYNSRGRFSLPVQKAAELASIAGLNIPSGITSYSLVSVAGSDGSMSPFATGLEYNGDYIDEGALSRMKKGDPVKFVIDRKDPYNVSLYNEAVSDPKKKGKFNKNVRIKVVDKDGNFVSVLAAEYGKKLSSVRSGAFDLFDASGETGAVSIGEGVVSSYMPGRPISFSDTPAPLPTESLNAVTGVGYILDGELVMKGGEKASTYPYAASFIRRSGTDGDPYAGVIIPVVSFRAANGVEYVYPVSLRERGADQRVIDLEADVNAAIEDQEFLLRRPDVVEEVNSLLLSYGVSDMSVPFVGDASSIQEKLKSAYEELSRVSTYADVHRWMKDSRTPREIAETDISSVSTFGVLYSPKIRVSTNADTSMLEESDTEEQTVDTVPKSDSEDLPFGNNGEPGTASSLISPAPSQGGPIPSMQEPTQEERRNTPAKRSSKRDFANLIPEFEGFGRYDDINDFLMQKVGFGELKFVSSRMKKGGRKNIRAFMQELGGTYVKGTEIEGGSQKEGVIWPDEYLSWLQEEAKTNSVVRDYLDMQSNSLSEGEILQQRVEQDLVRFLSAFRMKRSYMINTSHRRHGGKNNIIELNSVTEEEFDRFMDGLDKELISSGVAEITGDDFDTGLMDAVGSADYEKAKELADKRGLPVGSVSSILEEAASKSDNDAWAENVEEFVDEFNKRYKDGTEGNDGGNAVAEESETEGRTGEVPNREEDIPGNQEGNARNAGGGPDTVGLPAWYDKESSSVTDFRSATEWLVSEKKKDDMNATFAVKMALGLKVSEAAGVVNSIYDSIKNDPDSEYDVSKSGSDFAPDIMLSEKPSRMQSGVSTESVFAKSYSPINRSRVAFPEDLGVIERVPDGVNTPEPKINSDGSVVVEGFEKVGDGWYASDTYESKGFKKYEDYFNIYTGLSFRARKPSKSDGRSWGRKKVGEAEMEAFFDASEFTPSKGDVPKPSDMKDMLDGTSPKQRNSQIKGRCRKN